MQKIGIWKGKGHDRRGGTPRKVQVLAPVAGSADDVMFSLFFALHDELPTVRWTDLRWRRNAWSSKPFYKPLIGDILPTTSTTRKGGDSHC